MREFLKPSKLLYFYALLSFLTTVGCSEEVATLAPETEDIDLVLESFVFEKKNNPHLSEDIVFDIQNNTISGELKTYFFNAIPTFTTNANTVEINAISQVSATTAVDFRKSITYNLKSTSGSVKAYNLDITWDDALAHIYIDTEGGAPIVSKEDYLNTKITIDGQSKYEDRVFELSELARVKGRGNSTWSWPKKPFK